MKKLLFILSWIISMYATAQSVIFSPDTVIAHLDCGDTGTESLYISNLSGGSLSVNYLGISDSVSQQSTIFYSTTAATTTHNFSGFSGFTSDTLFLELTVNGDFDLTSEFADVYADGNYIGTLNPTVNNANVTATFFIINPVLASIVADGSISINIVNSAAVNTGFGTMMHRVRLYSNGVSWAQSMPGSTTLVAGDTVAYPIQFTTAGLNQGTYVTKVKVNTNDPANPSTEIIVLLHVNGTAEIVLSDTCLSFSGTLQNATSTLTFTYDNTGCDTLTMATLLSGSSAFQVDMISGNLLPGASDTAQISFTPPSVASFTDTLLLVTNVGVHPICLAGAGILPPVILTPSVDTIEVTLACDDSTTFPLWLYSDGPNPVTLTGGSAGGTGYDFTSEIFYSITDATTNHSFTGLTVVPDTLFVEITVNGDFDLTSEFADIYAEGNLIGTLNPTFNNTNVTATYFITGALLNTVLADGTLNISVDNSPSVNTGFGTMLHRVHIYSNGTPWVSGTFPATNIASGDSLLVNIGIQSSGLLTGIYQSTMQIASNDPVNPIYNIEIILTVTGAAEVSLSDTCITFPATLVGVSTVDSVVITNTGCENLTIASVTSNNANYSILSAPTTLFVGQQGVVRIQFTPASVGTFSGLITLATNVGDTTICLSGSGIPAPNLTFSPDTLYVTAGCNGVVTEYLTLYNTGGSNLDVTSVNMGGNGYDVTSELFYATTAATTTHSFTGLTSIPDTLYLEITINGDFDLTSEYADIYIDGNFVGTINPTVNTADVTQTFYIISPMVNAVLADGMATVEVINSSSVNTGYGTMLHRVRLYSNGVPWMSTSFTSTSIAVSDSTLVPVTIDAYGLAVGTYQASFTVSSNDPVNPTVVVPVVLTVPAIVCANFSGSGQNPCSGSIAFSDSSLGNPTSWLWSFGDGSTSTAQNPSHKYTSLGNFTVQLIACNSNGCDTVQQNVTITFLQAVSMSVTGDFTSGTSMQFTATGGTIISTTWDFGDGSSGAPGISVNHVYDSAGTYVVTGSVLTTGPCYFTLRDTVVITQGVLGLSFTHDPTTLVVFPNPSQGDISIQWSAEQWINSSVMIYSSSGALVYQFTITSNLQQESLPLENGMYMLRAITPQGVVVERKVIVAR